MPSCPPLEAEYAIRFGMARYAVFELMKTMLPVGLGLLMRLMFKAAKQNAKACRQTREDIDRRVTADLAAWRDEK